MEQRWVKAWKKEEEGAACTVAEKWGRREEAGWKNQVMPRKV